MRISRLRLARHYPRLSFERRQRLTAPLQPASLATVGRFLPGSSTCAVVVPLAWVTRPGRAFGLAGSLELHGRAEGTPVAVIAWSCAATAVILLCGAQALSLLVRTTAVFLPVVIGGMVFGVYYATQSGISGDALPDVSVSRAGGIAGVMIALAVEIVVAARTRHRPPRARRPEVRRSR